MPSVRKRARSRCSSPASYSPPSCRLSRRRTASGEAQPAPPSGTSRCAGSGARRSSPSTPLGVAGRAGLGQSLRLGNGGDVLDLVAGLRPLRLIERAALVARLVQIRVVDQLLALGARPV